MWDTTLVYLRELCSESPQNLHLGATLLTEAWKAREPAASSRLVEEEKRQEIEACRVDTGVGARTAGGEGGNEF